MLQIPSLLFIWRPKYLPKLDSVTDFKNIFQVNYKDTRITFLKHSFVVDIEHVFVCRCIFRNSNSEEFWKLTLLHLQEFSREYITTFLHCKIVASSVYSKSLNFTERNSSKDLFLQRQAFADVCKIDVLKDFAKFTAKYLYHILHLMKLQASSLQLYCKRDPGADVFL